MSGTVDAKLIAAIDGLLENMDCLDAVDSNKSIYTFEQKLQIIDRKTKVEALRLKCEEEEQGGSAFRRPSQGEKKHDAAN